MSVQVALFDDRLDVITPGSIPHGMSARLIKEGHSMARNRALALACKYMRIIESWGSGVLRVQKALEEYGLPALEIRDNGIDAEKMLEIIRVTPGINRVALSKALGVSVKTIGRYVTALKGYVKFEGPSRTGGYSCG